MKSNEVEAKHILTKSSISEIDLYFNPYIGCTFACAYCLVKYMKSFSGHTRDRWGSFVDCKRNTIDLLEKEIHKAKNKNVMMGSLTDVYQPVEKKYGIVRQSLELFSAHDISTYILTKSDLILRDVDIITNMPSAKIGVSIAFSDDAVRKAFEARSSSIASRLKTLRSLGKGKCKTFAFVGPIIPELSNLEEIFAGLREAKIDFVMGKSIDLNYPFAHDFLLALENMVGIEKAQAIHELAENVEYLNSIKHEFDNLCQKHGIENHGFINPYANLE